jgi:hypothetical protein
MLTVRISMISAGTDFFRGVTNMVSAPNINMQIRRAAGNTNM